MNPSRSNTDAGASSKDAEATRLMNSGEENGPPRDSSFRSSAPSAPLLETMEPEPPSYDSVVAQDTNDSKNRFSSSSTGNLHQAYNQAPYPTGPGSAPQTPYPPKAGYSPSEAPAQTPYPAETGYSPRAVGNPPYPGGPGLGSPVTSQPPHSTGSGYTPGPASQAPYPTGPMPMPGPVETGTQIGFVAPVTIEPKPSNIGYQNVGYRQRTSYFTPGEKDQYVHTTRQHATNQNLQQQQPTVIHVVQKNETTTSTDDDCCFWFCGAMFAQCLIECIEICADSACGSFD